MSLRSAAAYAPHVPDEDAIHERAREDAEGIEDFAFADTVVARDLDEAVPPSGIVVSDERGEPQCLVPVRYPLPAPVPSGPGMRLRITRIRLWLRMRRGLQSMREEMHLLWSATASLEEVHDENGAIIRDADPLVRAATIGRRVRTLFSFFEWDRADILRAVWIGLSVFVVAATIGALVVQLGD